MFLRSRLDVSVTTKKLIMRRLCTVMAALLLALYSFAGVEPYTNSIRGQLKKGDSLIVKDEKFRLAAFDWKTIKKQKVHNLISLQVFQDTNAVLPKAFSAEVNLKMAYYAHPDQAEPLYINNIKLKVKYDKDSLHKSKLIDVHSFENGHWVKVTVEDVKADGGQNEVPPFLQLTVQAIADRQYQFDPTRPVRATYTVQETGDMAAASFDADEVGAPAPTEIQISLPNAGDNEFDIEWTTLDRGAGYDALITSLLSNQSVPVETLNELFRNNATRVTTHGGEYTVTVNHYNNFLFFRVRSVSYQDGVRDEGLWDYKQEEGSFAMFDITDSWHQPDLNWQYTATYAEEGKKKEVVSYFDGSLRSRQTVTVNNADQTAVVQESVYDQYGRAVASILPAPINAKALAYYKRLHLNPNGQVYSAADAIDPSGCETIPKSLAATDLNNPAVTLLGAGKYYSPSNGFLKTNLNTYDANKYIPDAEGFPLAITRYTPDNTGRVKWQGGVGKAFQPAATGSRTTKYFYGKPLQEELDKLFGNEVGYAEHYLKNMVVDANGQVSVSYLDASGKTIATALAGETPSMVESLPGKPEKKQETRKLIKPQQFQYDYTNLTLSATTTYLAEVPGSANLLFDVEKLIYKYTKSNWQICSNCYYDLTIKVFDDCGTPIYTTNATEKIGTESSDCNAFGTFSKEISLNFDKIGEYKVSFQLALSRQVVENYTEKYIEERKQRKDWKTKFRFIEDYAKLQDFSSCFDDCATCEEELGTKEAFIANGFAQLKIRGITTENGEMDSEEAAAFNTWLDTLYSSLSAQCQALKANCNYSPCDRYEKLMLEDVSPFGQYAPFRTTGTGFSDLEALEPEINVLSKYWRTVFPVLAPGTETYEKAAFEDDNGNRISPHGASFTLQMLVRYWKSEWAKHFLTYHPEKCKLDFCNNNAQFINWDNQVQEEIRTAAAISTHHATQGSGYSYSNPAWLVDKDPFFKTGNPGAAYVAEMRADLQQYTKRVVKATSAPNKNLTQFIDYMLYCVDPSGNTSTGSNGDSWNTCAPKPDCRVENREWDMYKEWYFQQKEKYYDLLRKNTACASACEVGTPISLPSASACPQKNEFSVVSGDGSGEACAANQKPVRVTFSGSNTRTLTVALQYAAPYNSWGYPASVTINSGQSAAMFCVSKEVPLSAIYITGVTCTGTPPTPGACPFGNGDTLKLPSTYQRNGNTFSYTATNTGNTLTYTILNGKPDEVPAASTYCTNGTPETNFYNCYTIQPSSGLPIHYYNVWVIKCTIDPCANSNYQLTGMTQISANKFRKDNDYYYVNTSPECASPVTVYQNVPCLKVFVNGQTAPIRFLNATVTRCSVCDAGLSGSAAVTQDLGYNTFRDAQGGLYEIHPNTTSSQITWSDVCASPQRSWYDCFTIDLNGVKTVYYNATVFYCAPVPPDPCTNAPTIYASYVSSNRFYNVSSDGCYTYRTDYYVYTGSKPSSPPSCSGNGYWSDNYACVKFNTGSVVYEFRNAWIWYCYNTTYTCGGGGGECPAMTAVQPEVVRAFKKKQADYSAMALPPPPECPLLTEFASQQQAGDRYYVSYPENNIYLVQQDSTPEKGRANRKMPKARELFTQWQYKEHFYIRTDSATYLNFQDVWVAEYRPARKTGASSPSTSSTSIMACPTISDFDREEVIQEDYYQGSSNYEEVRSVKDIYLRSKTGPVTRSVTFTVTTETQTCANCSYNYTTSTVTLNPGEERVYVGTFTLDYAVDLQFGIYYRWYYQNPMVPSDGISCQPEPCDAPILQNVTPKGGTEFEVTYSNVNSSVTSVLVQTSTDGANWSSHSGPIASPRTVYTTNTTGTWYFRIAAYCGDAPYYSNVMSYTFSSCPAVYQYKQPRFISVDRNMPALDPTTEMNNGMEQLKQQIKTSCEGQAEQWMASLQDGFAAKGFTIEQIAELKQKLKEVCIQGGDIDHPNGASTALTSGGVADITLNTTTSGTYRAMRSITLETGFETASGAEFVAEIAGSDGPSFKKVMQALLTKWGKGSFDMDFNPWLLESPYPWDKKPQAVEQTLTATSQAVCDKLAQYQQQYQANTGGVSFYRYLVNRFGAAMSITEAQLNILLKGCNNCKYLLEEAMPLPVFLEPGATGCITKGEWDAAQAAFVGEFVPGAIKTDHDKYGDAWSTYLNHRWGFTLTYDQYRTYEANLAKDAAAILCNQPVYSPVTIAPYECFNSLMATVITNGQRDYEAYVEQEKKIFRTNYVATCLTVQPNVRLTAWQQTYHYTLYYYDQAGNLVKTVPPKGVSLLNEVQVARVDYNRQFDPANCVYDGPGQNTSKTDALQNLSTTLSATGNHALEFWLYNNTTGANQVLASTPDKKYMYHSCINGQLLSIDIYKLEQTATNHIDFVHSNHLTVDIGAIQPLNSWTHVVVQGSELATGLLQVFVNGTLRNAVAGDPPAGCGWEVAAGDPIVLPENLGTLKQLRFYNRMLNGTEIAANAAQSCLGLSQAYKPGLSPNLFHWARFMTPPAGSVGTINGTTTETQVEPLYPAHNLVTTYQYNSMGQVVTQSTPDAGRSNFWYDRLGRLTASQNAEQLAPEKGGAANRYSYTKYDNLGRISEVGEKEDLTMTMPSPGIIDEAKRTLFLATGTDKQVTATVYDAPTTATGAATGLVQTNLRKRVAASLYKPLGSGPVEAASYYSYDAAGNVNTLWQQVPSLGLKRLDYQYDLVSGKVNAVLYQHGQPDAFYYQYAYDAENRLVTAYSNNIGFLTLRGLLDIRPLGSTHTDATYTYYLHGPLLRLELGQQKVQGVDYAYTLQGWLKGINGQKLDPATDMGKDNWTIADNGNSDNGRDVLAFSLGYYKGDYKPIGGAGAPAFGLSYESQTGDVTGKGLYNGNISHSTLALSKFRGGEPVGYSYGYDQLNRLKELRQHTLTAGSSTWNSSSITEQYKESYHYDANGNILSLLRNGTTEGGRPLAMDQLIYHYQPNTNQLAHVSDAIGDGNYSEDIDNQAVNNYRYDKIGNLIQDVKEGITDIQWTVYGKIRSVTKSNGTTITYSYDATGNRIAKAVTTGGETTTTYYIRDAQGNTLAVYEGASKKEQYLYGSSRLGVYNPAIDQRSYELTNHLGNVLATVSEHKINTGASQEADILSMQDYYPGGMSMAERSFSNGSKYRYGFNGKELDTDGNVVQYDYGFRIYDPRLVRFKSVDPLMRGYPMLTPYQFASNTPIQAIDLDGLEATYYDKSGKVVCSGPCDQGNASARGWFLKDQTGALRPVPKPSATNNTVHSLPPANNSTSNTSTSTTENILEGAWSAFRSLWVRDKPLGSHGSDASEDPGIVEGLEQIDNTIRYGSKEEKEKLAGGILLGIIINKTTKVPLPATSPRYNPSKAAVANKSLQIPASANGYSPDFSGTPYLYAATANQKSIVQIKLTGAYSSDFSAANAAAGISGAKAPKGYTWHHLDDYNPSTGTATMQLVKSDVHQATVPHTGGVKQYEVANNVTYKQ